MKKYLYYILIVVVIINNYNILNTHNNAKKYLSKMDKTSEKEHIYVKNLHNLIDSKYVDDMKSISIIDENIKIDYKLNDDKNIKDIVEDVEKLLEKEVISTSIEDDNAISLEI